MTYLPSLASAGVALQPSTGPASQHVRGGYRWRGGFWRGACERRHTQTLLVVSSHRAHNYATLCACHMACFTAPSSVRRWHMEGAEECMMLFPAMLSPPTFAKQCQSSLFCVLDTIMVFDTYLARINHFLSISRALAFKNDRTQRCWRQRIGSTPIRKVSRPDHQKRGKGLAAEHTSYDIVHTAMC